MFNIQVEHREGKVFRCAEKEDVLTAARRQGVAIPLGCRGGGCGMCKIQVTKGKFDRGKSSMEVLPEGEREKNYSLACKTYPLGDLTIKI
ncbi:2Fe-2S iron-sulfur cluster binding domain-containing protein [Ammoniphilus sp. YIM 78166]|uniref:2Fe-2S iron-sulfur cluster binding domain-containing protein n=1 Tax=Ammoniphilus sp. YIM 78166 TaxID=1644106 RepID=UPI00106F838D|nr:2Fe-2S iron-sulfur cluster binding domain-containing protein [Ammoniphilus sp. YIM 78166]